MPVQGFGQGYLQGQAAANDRERIQMAAEAQQRLFKARDAVNTASDDLMAFRQQTAEVVDGLQQELDNNRADFQMLKLERAASSMLGGDIRDIRDTFNNPDLKELYLNDDGIKDFFSNSSGLAGVRTYNPNDEDERRAYDRYIKEKYGEGADTSDTKALSDNDVYTYQMVDGSVQVYDRTAVARALGLGAESSSIRQMIEDQDKIDEDLMKKEGIIRQEVSDEELKKRQSALTAAQQKLAAEDTSYKPPEADKPLTAIEQANLTKVLLQNEKLAQEIKAAGKDPADLVKDLPVLAKFAKTEEDLSALLFNSGDYTQEQADTIAANSFPAIKEDRELGQRETKAGIGKTESDTKLSDAKAAALAKEGTSEEETKEYMLKLGRAYGASKGADTSDDNAAIQLAEKAAKEGGFINDKGEYVSPTTQQVSEQKSMFKKLSPDTEAEYIVKETAYDKEYGTALNAQSRKNLQAINQITAGSEGFATHLTGGEKGVIDSNIGNPIARVFNEQQNEADREGYIKLVGILVSQNFIQNRSSKYLVEQVMSAINANSWSANETAVLNGIDKALESMKEIAKTEKITDGNIWRKPRVWDRTIKRVDVARKAIEDAKKRLLTNDNRGSRASSGGRENFGNNIVPIKTPAITKPTKEEESDSAYS